MPEHVRIYTSLNLDYSAPILVASTLNISDRMPNVNPTTMANIVCFRAVFSVSNCGASLKIYLKEEYYSFCYHQKFHRHTFYTFCAEEIFVQYNLVPR
jgi:hypothetical protein